MSLDNGFVTAEFLRNVAERMRAFKQLSYEHMAIATGGIVGRRNDTTLVRPPTITGLSASSGRSRISTEA